MWTNDRGEIHRTTGPAKVVLTKVKETSKCIARARHSCIGDISISAQ